MSTHADGCRIHGAVHLKILQEVSEPHRHGLHRAKHAVPNNRPAMGLALWTSASFVLKGFPGAPNL